MSLIAKKDIEDEIGKQYVCKDCFSHYGMSNFVDHIFEQGIAIGLIFFGLIRFFVFSPVECISLTILSDAHIETNHVSHFSSFMGYY